jgi:hypothetical protein
METGKLEIPKDNSIPKIAEGTDSQSFLNNLMDMNFYIENKNYIYILLVIIALVIIGFYIYKKYIKLNQIKLDSPNNNKKEKEKEKGKKEKDSENEEDDKKILNPMEKYYIIDKKGNPILINPFLNDLLTNNLVSGKEFEGLLKVNKELNTELEKIKNDNSKKQKEREKEKERPKLSHPNENTNQNIPENILMTDAEDENLATQDLTDGEIAELKKQLQILQRNQNYKVMAQNDEDDD